MGKCLRTLTKVVRGCSRQRQDVGGVALLAGLFWAAMAWGQAYIYESLGTFLPSDIAEGQIAGCSSNCFFAARIIDGVFQVLNHPEASGRGFAINSAGVVVGLSGAVSGQAQAYAAMVWDAAGVGTALPRPTSMAKTPFFSVGTCVNVAGTIGGQAVYDPSPTLPVRWRQGQAEILDTQGQSGSVDGLNDHDEAVGWVAPDGASQRAAFWDAKGRLTVLDTLGGAESAATAINNQHRIVGWAADQGGVRHAVIWQKGHVFRVLPGDHCSAAAINSANAIVGGCSADASGQGGHAVLWMPPFYIPFDLNTVAEVPPGITLEAATGIDDAGRIVGEASSGQQGQGFLLTPAPAMREMWLNVAGQP